MVGIIIFTIFVQLSILAQEYKFYPVLSHYSNWGIVAGPALYNKAHIFPQYGDYTIESKPMWGFNAGIEYDFSPAGKWSVITGLLVAYEPGYKIEFTIKQEDIYPHFTEDCSYKTNMYAFYSFHSPLLVRLNIQINQNMFANFISGLKVMYFPHGSGSLSVVFHNEDDTESRQVFFLECDSPDNSFQGSYIIGTGISIALDKMLIKSNLIYVWNFQNTMEGYYMFDNMFSSAPAGGDYELSGNYLGLMFSVSLAKKKHKDN